MNTKKNNCKLISIIISITILGILAVPLSLLLMLPNSDDNSLLTNSNSSLSNRTGNLGCTVFPEKIIFAHRGGNTTLYQENTLEVFLDSVTKNRSIELDLMLLESGEIVTFHDINTLEKTGYNYELLYTPWSVISQLTYLNIVDNHVYASKPKIPLLSQALEIICSVNPKTNLWFDIKYNFNARFITFFLDALDASPCACDDKQKIVVEVFRDISGLQSLKAYMMNRRCHSVIGAISYYDYQVGMSLEKLKEEMDLFSQYAGVIDFPASFVKEFPEIFNYNIKKFGICNCAYGDDPKEMSEILNNTLMNAAIYNFYE